MDQSRAQATSGKRTPIKEAVYKMRRSGNVELARKMLAESGRPIIGGTDLTDAAKKVVATLAS